MLRRQVKRPLRIPLVAITPKSLLRHKDAISTLEDLTEGVFQTVIPDVDNPDPKKVKRVIMCSGKVYYELLEKKRAENRTDTAVIRIEQLYPFPSDDLEEVLAPFTKISEVVWCQEEPMNQGAWYCSQHHMRGAAHTVNPKLYLKYAGRPASAAPASGYGSVHVEEQTSLVNDAFEI
jgi:2-oxoglutarate dehydrogenase E1 component